MANRHLSRSVAMQTLFERDFNHIDDRNVIETLLDRNAKEFAPGMGDLSFARFILDSTLKYQGKIDASDYTRSSGSPIFGALGQCIVDSRRAL